MVTLISFYSKSGNTLKLAEMLAKKYNGKTEVSGIKEKKQRKGIIGWILSGRDALKREDTEISIKVNPDDYDTIIIGTPIWAGNMAPAVRAFLNNHNLKKKNLAFFCTHGGGGNTNAFKEMEGLSHKPISTLEIKGKYLSNCSKEDSERIDKKIESFWNRIDNK